MRKILGALVVAIATMALLSTSVLAVDLGKNWRVYNVKPATSSYWDINKLATNGTFPIQQFDTQTSGSFAVYVLNNYNVDVTGKTLTADLAWTPGTYKTRSATCAGAYVRFEFQDVTAGRYDSNDYWWSTVNLDLNAVTSGDLIASLADRTLWTNQSGKSATDPTEDWQQWQGDVVHMSPFDGFTKAMKNVKQIGLSFGSSCTYASGVALDVGSGTFTMTSYTVTP
jgi:hypothetical protein